MPQMKPMMWLLLLFLIVFLLLIVSIMIHFSAFPPYPASFTAPSEHRQKNNFALQWNFVNTPPNPNDNKYF